jgi:hypothetical protein
MSAADVSRSGRDDRRQRELAVFISIRTILLVGVAVALAWRWRRSATSCC